MKKTNKYLAIACTGVLAIAGCQKPEMEDAANAAGQTTVIEATLSDEGIESKTQMTPGADADTYKVEWQAGDAVQMNGNPSTAIAIKEDASNASFTFEGASFDAPYYAVYPAAAATAFADAAYTLSLPKTQTYVGSDKFSPEASLMLGYSAESGKVAFRHAMAYIRLTLSAGDAPVRSVTFESNNQEAMAGTFKATCTDGAWTLAKETGSVYAVDLVCEGEGAAIGDKMLVAIPAGTYAEGFRIVVKDTQSHYMVKKSTAQFIAEAGGIYDMSFDFVSQGTVVEGDIYTVSDWTAFAKAVAGGNTYEGQTITLKSDLSVDTYFEYANGTFEGTFDGNGKTMTANGNKWPLFGTIGANSVVKNLTMDGKFTEFANYGEAGNATIAKINLGLIENCTNNADTEITGYTRSIIFGSIAGQNGGTIKGCKNYGNISITVAMSLNANDAGFYGGGLAAIGHTTSGSATNGALNTDASCVPGKFINCENHGDIELYVTKNSDGGNSYAPLKSGFGGICGVVYLDNVEFSGCHNYGDITRKDIMVDNTGPASSQYFSSVGGILGRSAATNVSAKTYGAIDANATTNGYNTIISGCTNNGTIKNYCRHSTGVSTSDSGARKDASGGIVGVICGKSETAQVNDCTNTGSVFTGWPSVSSGVSGGIAGTANNTKFLDCTSTGTVGTESSSNPLGATGGIVGMAFKDVVFDGCKAVNTANMYYASGKTLYWGLCCGIIITSASITKTNKVCTFGGTASVNGTSQNISAENYTTMLTASAGKALTYDVANVSYSAN